MGYTLVTGATGGIGSALCRRLDARPLIVHGRRSDAVDRLIDDLGRSEPTVGWVCDLGAPETIESSWNQMLAELRADHNHDVTLDAVVHCAAMVELGSVADQGTETWARALALNLAGPAELTRLALPHLRTQDGSLPSTIIFVNSTAGLVTNPNWGSYAAGKWGLRSLADAVRAEESPNGVRVTSIYPGRTATGMQRTVRAMEGEPYDPERYLDPSSVAASIVHCLDAPADAAIWDLTIKPAPARR